MSARAMSPQSRCRDPLLLLGCAAMLLATEARNLDAQVLRLRPIADLSFPTRVSLKDGAIQVRQKISLSLGAQMTMAFSDRFDVVTTVAYSPGAAILQGSRSRVELASSAHSLSGTTGARYWLLPPPRTLALEFHTGVGVVFGGTPAYQDLFERSTLNGVVGSTLLYQIGRIVTLKLRVQERLIRLRFGADDGTGLPRPFRVSFGLGFPFLESLR